MYKPTILKPSVRVLHRNWQAGVLRVRAAGPGRQCGRRARVVSPAGVSIAIATRHWDGVAVMRCREIVVCP